MKLYRTITTAVLLCVLSLSAAADDLQANLRRHIDYLCSPHLEGRLAGSDGERLAAGYLYDQLEAVGLEMFTDRNGDTFTIVGTDSNRIVSQNIVGILEGEDHALREEYIVIGAHIDHLGYYTVNIDGTEQKRIYPGACANASGVAALIETARLVREHIPAPRRSIVFVGFGAMEQEFAGSRFFASTDGFGQIGNVKLMVNLDILGRGTAANPFEVYPSLPLAQLQAILDYVLENESVPAVPAIHNGVVFPSDNLAFRQAEIPALTFSTGIFREYRTVKDTPDLVQESLLAAQTVYIAAFLRSVADMEILQVSDGVKPEKIYSLQECETQPKFFRGGVQSFLDNWVYKYLNYPQEAIAQGVDGYQRIEDSKGKVTYKAVVYVSFIIEADGNISNVAIERGFSEPLDDEALRVVSASPKWKPATIDGKKVRTKIVIPVEYHLKNR